ncbi:cysteine peptidase family C39 domain-containing protein [Aromatoleum aromaticum]|uniref:cysteine peptidase family C39 domain-containing protein n=1 Tax=Aromatoleum aromaticum TaxID=551760 RepID=UPI001459C62D|nr:cysteine peptidase family C39 domain-containing protein [Aromatoleum aromaticum]NMG55469.1 hypothetical protein [Aromatoleum aromaticum]
MKPKFHFYQQIDLMDCGPTCLRMIARYHGHTFNLDTLREKSGITREGVSFGEIADAAEAIGQVTLGMMLAVQYITGSSTVQSTRSSPLRNQSRMRASAWIGWPRSMTATMRKTVKSPSLLCCRRCAD